MIRSTHVVLAPDSFKEALEARRVAQAIAKGWRSVEPSARLHLCPMADGGEGTVDAVVAATGGEWVTAQVTGPRGEPVEARYGRFHGGESAVIEMAAASGLPLVPPGERDPRHTSTRGTGELVIHALARGARRILLGIGGSATNDGGAGFAQALGVRLLDDTGSELPPGGAALAALKTIDCAGLDPRLARCDLLVACDVRNPLTGVQGASNVFGPQKGATEEMVDTLDAALTHYARIIEQQLNRDVAQMPGSGAAGGLGAGLLAFTDATLKPGVELVAELTGLPALLADADLVITGEGRVDGQTAQGKVAAGVARFAAAAGVPVIMLCGTLGEGYEALYEEGICAMFSIAPGPLPLDLALAQTEAHLEATARNLARVWTGARSAITLV